MALRVIGAGLGRTGTMSLKLAVERLLGGRCYHMDELYPRQFAGWTAASRGEPVDWNTLLRGFVGAVDWPASAFWRELSVVYPDATIVLSTRDSASWWKSASATIFDVIRASPPGPMKTMIETMFASRFTAAIHDREEAIRAYERHNADVRATAPPDRLVEWQVGDGWEALCGALRLPVPEEPFPHANTTEEFKARIASGPVGY